MPSKRQRPERKQKPLSPVQVENQLKALDRLYNTQSVNVITDEDYDRMKAQILARLHG